LKIIRLIVTAADTVQKKTGSYPPLLLNAIYIDETSQSVTFLPFSVIDCINGYHGGAQQTILYSCLSGTRIGSSNLTVSKSMQMYGTKEIFFWGVARLIYLFFTIGRGFIDSPPYPYLQNYIADIPRTLADTVWNTLHRKEYDGIMNAVTQSIDARQGTHTDRIPLLKREKVTILSQTDNNHSDLRRYWLLPHFRYDFRQT
jgi:hypothetical protein